MNGFYPKIWNFEYEQKVSSVFQEWIRHDYPNGEHVIYLSIKLDSCEPIWIHYDENLQSKFNQKDLRQGDAITIIYFKAEEDDDDSEPVFVDIKMNYQQTLDELLSSSPKDALALTDEDKDWLNFPAGGNEIR